MLIKCYKVTMKVHSLWSCLHQVAWVHTSDDVMDQVAAILCWYRGGGPDPLGLGVIQLHIVQQWSGHAVWHRAHVQGGSDVMLRHCNTTSQPAYNT